MSTTFILLVNTVLAALASGVNVWAGIQWRSKWMTSMYVAVAVFAAVYSCGFMYIYFVGDGKWTPIARTLSIFVWPIVWILPSLLATKKMKMEAGHLLTVVHEKQYHLAQRADRGLEL